MIVVGLVLVVVALALALSGRRNPVDVVGVWYSDQPLWKRLVIFLLAADAVIIWWLAYQFRRGWFGPPAD